METCSITGLSIQRNIWHYESMDKSYRLEVSVLDSDIYLIKPIGSGTKEYHLESLPILQNIYKRDENNRKVFLLHDYSELYNTDTFSRKHYASLVLEHIDKFHLVVFFQTNRILKVVITAGKFISNKFDKVIIVDNLHTAVKKCLDSRNVYINDTPSEGQSIENIQNTPSLYSSEHEEVICIESKEYKTVYNPKWNTVISESIRRNLNIIDGNIFSLEIIGSITRESLVILNNELDKIIDTLGFSEKKYIMIMDFALLGKISMQSRRLSIQWFSKNIKNLQAVIICNQTPVLNAVVKFSAELDPAFKGKIHLTQNRMDAIRLAIKIKYRTQVEAEKAQSSVIPNLSLAEENQVLKKEIEALRLNQEKKVKHLVSILGRISWDNEYTPESNLKLSEKDPFYDLYSVASMLNSDIHEIMEEKDKLIIKAKESDRLKTSFLANISHEIRTPMNSIMGFSKMLSKDSISTREKEELTIHIERNCRVLMQIIDDMMDISKIEAGIISLKKGAVNMNKLVTDLVLSFNRMKTILDKEHIEITITQKPEIEIITYTDSGRITQILSNLINNALKYTEKGTIEIGFYLDKDSRVMFFVKDTGIGIPEEHQNQIFNRFYKVQNDTGQRGVGLGLSIVKQLLDILQGEISLKSEYGKGSIFQVSIPYEECTVTIGPKVNIENTLQGKRILIAEDDDGNYVLAKMILEEYQAIVTRAYNGQEAIDLCVNSYNIDIVLMDYMMPVMNGLDAVRKIKEKRPLLPVIMQTAHVLDSEREKAYEAGCDGYISKPLDEENLLLTISNLDIARSI